MITTLKKHEIRSKETNNLISEYTLKINGFTYELHTLTDIILVGIEAERHYSELLDFNKKLIEQMPDLKLVIVK